MKIGGLEILKSNDMFLFSFDGPHGPRSLGVSDDLESFVKGRIESGMRSPELKAALEQFKELGDTHDWDLDKIAGASRQG